MKARQAAQIRRGIRFALLWDWLEVQYRRSVYLSFRENATRLEYRAFEEYRKRHWSD